MGNDRIAIIIDTDIGEDIDDLLALAFALNSPEFEILAITTVDGDTIARSRIARRVVSAYGYPAIPVAAGNSRGIPQANEPYPPLTAVTQNAVAPTEEGLPPASSVPADELIASMAARYPKQVYVVTIGSMTNIGQALVRYPETADNLAGIITNGGNFGPDRETSIGWNLRYDPVAAAVVARSDARWVLLPEGMDGLGGLTAADVGMIRQRGLETTNILMLAIENWRRNKKECDPETLPHLSDLRCFAYLLGETIDTCRGRVYLTIGPRGTLAELRVETDPAGPHILGWKTDRRRGQDLHDLFMQRILSEPHQKLRT